jgi:hypothetical protein
VWLSLALSLSLSLSPSESPSVTGSIVHTVGDASEAALSLSVARGGGGHGYIEASYETSGGVMVQ